MRKITIIVLAFLLFAGYAFADSYVVVRVSGLQEPDQMIAYVVDIKDYDVLQGNTSGKYVQFQITDFDDYESIKNYLAPWHKQIEWEFLGHNYTLDGHRLRVWMTNMSASGLNSLTRTQVENFLNRWNATVNEALTVNNNEVVFDAVVLDAIESEGFWDVDTGNAVFTEKDYDQTSGLHTVEINYSATGWPAEIVAMRIEEKGGTVTKNIPGKIEFTILRSTVFDEFKRSVKEALESQQFSEKLFRVPDQYVQAALNAGGTLQITKNQFTTYIRSRLDD